MWRSRSLTYRLLPCSVDILIDYTCLQLWNRNLHLNTEQLCIQLWLMDPWMVPWMVPRVTPRQLKITREAWQRIIVLIYIGHMMYATVVGPHEELQKWTKGCQKWVSLTCNSLCKSSHSTHHHLYVKKVKQLVTFHPPSLLQNGSVSNLDSFAMSYLQLKHCLLWHLVVESWSLN